MLLQMKGFPSILCLNTTPGCIYIYNNNMHYQVFLLLLNMQILNYYYIMHHHSIYMITFSLFIYTVLDT